MHVVLKKIKRAIILSYGVSDSFDSTNLVKSLSKDEKKAIKSNYNEIVIV